MHDLIVKETDRILIIAPHPDDECIGAGGILSRYPSKCSVVVLTDGANGVGSGYLQADILRNMRREEFLSEMNYLNISDYTLLDYPDGSLTKYKDCLFSFDLSVYTKIFVTHKNDNHSDHTAAFYCLTEALKFQGIENTEVYAYEVHNSLANPTHILNITDSIGCKKRLSEFHKSQKNGRYDEFAIVQAKYRAFQNKLENEYVEAYERVNMKSAQSGTDAFAEISERNQKHEMFYSTLIKWLELKIRGYSILSYLKEENIRTLVIYGYAEMGKLLYKELESSSVNTLYILDNKEIKQDSPSIRKPLKLYEQPDIIIVTAIYYFDEIKEKLTDLGYKRIESMSDIINKLYEKL